MRQSLLFAVSIMMALQLCAARAASGAAATNAPQLSILDTDIGDDIDDAYALGLVLRSPELKLLGVTTAAGYTETRAQIVDRFLNAVGRTDVPVYAGVTTPYEKALTQGAYAKRQPEHKHGDGVAFILNQARTHPGEVTLIAIGPLFNVQAAIERDAATFKKLKRVVIMGGSIDRGDDGPHGEHTPPYAEWNIVHDPKGLQLLLGSGVPVYMMPLDSTQIALKMEDRERMFAVGSPMTDQLALLYHEWFVGWGLKQPSPILYDLVAVTYTFRPDICPATPMHIDADDKGFTRRGKGAPNAQVCMKSDEKAFLDLVKKRLDQ